MATSLSFQGLSKSPVLIPSKRIQFSTSVASATGFLHQKRVLCCPSRTLRISCQRGVVEKLTADQIPNGSVRQLSCVMKFGGSSIASGEKMREVAALICNFSEERPVIVLSAMGKTTNKLLQAGEKAVSCGVSNVSDIDELNFIKELHCTTVDELGVDRSTISTSLDELELCLKGIAIMKELTRRTKDYLVSFGVCMSTRIFAAYLNKIGANARQYDAFDIGFITTDDFTNADILEATYPAVAKRLHGDWISDPAIPVVTGFLGKGWKTSAVTTLGRGGSDLTATTIGKALGLREIQVWKDADGFLTCDPNIYPHAEPVPRMTFDEAAEHTYFDGPVLHPKSMQPAREGDIPVRVKSSYNPKAPGTLITTVRDMSEVVLTSIVLKRNVTMLHIVSTRMLGQSGFLAKVFSIIEEFSISVDVVTTSEVSISLTLDPSKLWRRELIQQELEHLVEELEKIAVVNILQHRSIISLIGNMQRSSLIQEKALSVLIAMGINFQNFTQGLSKVKMSLIVHDSEGEQCLRVLHLEFFERRVPFELNTADAFQNSFPGSSRETSMGEGSASTSHVPDSNASPSRSASASHVPDSNATPSRSASASHVPVSNATPSRSASASHVPDSNATPSRSASASHVPDSNATPSRLASASHVPDSNATPSRSASASPVPDSNATPSRSASASHAPDSNATPSRSASASHVPDSNATPSGSASTTHVPDLNATPKGSASASNMPDSNSALLNLLAKWDKRTFHALLDSKDVKGLQGILTRVGVILAFLIALLALIYKLTAGR